MHTLLRALLAASAAVLGACERAPSPAAATAASPPAAASAPAPAVADTVLTTTQPPVQAAPPTSAASPPPMARDLRSCFPPELDGAWAEAARVEEGGRAWVRLAPWNAPEDFRGVLVLIAEGGCMHEFVGVDAPAPSDVPIRSRASRPTTARSTRRPRGASRRRAAWTG